ncbi:MAG TPA: hypothetical protein VN213_18800 [Solirubrobacteraceae bacterium]|nr:hypothetical protein [Solirubrobacteraceae bacterium]
MDYALVVNPDELRAHLDQLRADNTEGRKRLAELIAAAAATQAASHAARERRRRVYRHWGDEPARHDADAPGPAPGEAQQRAVEPDPLDAEEPDW